MSTDIFRILLLAVLMPFACVADFTLLPYMLLVAGPFFGCTFFVADAIWAAVARLFDLEDDQP